MLQRATICEKEFQQSAQPSGGRTAYLFKLTSTGFLFEHRSTGATARRSDCLPFEIYLNRISI
ncbi:MAG: hypothetical protein LBT09_07975 [Planctomycetaceae bacterium]|nr:hypothetical protein [Planctomycetaceae bacterium]